MRSNKQGMHAVYHKVVKRNENQFDAYLYDKKGGSLLNKATGRTKEIALKLVKRAVSDTQDIPTLVERYKASPEFTNLNILTQANYTRLLKKFTDAFGHYTLPMFSRLDIKVDLAEWRDESQHTPKAADDKIQIVSIFFKWLLARGICDAQPTRGIASIHRADRSHIIWTPEDIEVLRDSTPPNVMRVVDLACHLGLRMGDILNLKWENVRATKVAIKTSKRKRFAFPPITEECRKVLQECATYSGHSEYVVLNGYGNPWTANGFGSRFYRFKKMAGISGKHFHDFRGTAVTNFYKSGYRNSEIAAIVGWSEDTVETMLKIYVDTSSFLDAAFERVNSEAKTQNFEGHNGDTEHTDTAHRSLVIA
ncbi:tyrosine-type recombinase/integrase [Asticcacaulis sp. AND118]|uniref:tyrosine-type recombinase/integrase n=1 Tax=Asticcacaulis sp. AND118 TaxID=2840468 RepID=UPI001D0008AA|nr:tyrosine-type recombinase/integrase [Asticcacaulis sp. AND118]UDF05073.1 tyrosine-type recombinase/integrase [Asticcacaulis sp. AND118]